MAQLHANPPSERLWLDQPWPEEEWRPAHGAAAGSTSVTEFTRPPETVDDWTDLLTLEVIWRTSKVYDVPQFTFDTVPSPAEFMLRLRQAVEAQAIEPGTFRVPERIDSGPYPSITF